MPWAFPQPPPCPQQHPSCPKGCSFPAASTAAPGHPHPFHDKGLERNMKKARARHPGAPGQDLSWTHAWLNPSSAPPAPPAGGLGQRGASRSSPKPPCPKNYLFQPQAGHPRCLFWLQVGFKHRAQHFFTPAHTEGFCNNDFLIQNLTNKTNDKQDKGHPKLFSTGFRHRLDPDSLQDLLCKENGNEIGPVTGPGWPGASRAASSCCPRAVTHATVRTTSGEPTNLCPPRSAAGRATTRHAGRPLGEHQRCPQSPTPQPRTHGCSSRLAPGPRWSPGTKRHGSRFWGDPPWGRRWAAASTPTS